MERGESAEKAWEGRALISNTSPQKWLQFKSSAGVPRARAARWWYQVQAKVNLRTRGMWLLRDSH